MGKIYYYSGETITNFDKYGMLLRGSVFRRHKDKFYARSFHTGGEPKVWRIIGVRSKTGKEIRRVG